MNAIKVFFVVAAFVAVVDLTWLGWIMRETYSQDLGSMARRSATGGLSPNLPASVAVYVLIPLGIVLFVLPSFTAATTLPRAFAWGGLFGLVVYGVYDLTCYAVLAQYPLRMVFYDILWGCALCGSASVVARVANTWLARS